MRAFDILLFLALLGAVNGALDYMYQSEFSNNWFGTHTEKWDMEMVVIDNSTLSQFEESKNGEPISQGEQDSFITNLLGVSEVVFGALYMLFELDDKVLDVIFYVPHPDDPSVNLFAPINDFIMVGLYVIIFIGFYQIKSKTSVKHYE